MSAELLLKAFSKRVANAKSLYSRDLSTKEGFLKRVAEIDEELKAMLEEAVESVVKIEDQAWEQLFGQCVHHGLRECEKLIRVQRYDLFQVFYDDDASLIEAVFLAKFPRSSEEGGGAEIAPGAEVQHQREVPSNAVTTALDQSSGDQEVVEPDSIHLAGLQESTATTEIESLLLLFQQLQDEQLSKKAKKDALAVAQSQSQENLTAGNGGMSAVSVSVASSVQLNHLSATPTSIKSVDQEAEKAKAWFLANAAQMSTPTTPLVSASSSSSADSTMLSRTSDVAEAGAAGRMKRTRSPEAPEAAQESQMKAAALKSKLTAARQRQQEDLRRQKEGGVATGQAKKVDAKWKMNDFSPEPQRTNPSAVFAPIGASFVSQNGEVSSAVQWEGAVPPFSCGVKGEERVKHAVVKNSHNSVGTVVASVGVGERSKFDVTQILPPPPPPVSAAPVLANASSSLSANAAKCSAVQQQPATLTDQEIQQQINYIKERVFDNALSGGKGALTKQEEDREASSEGRPLKHSAVKETYAPATHILAELAYLKRDEVAGNKLLRALSKLQNKSEKTEGSGTPNENIWLKELTTLDKKVLIAAYNFKVRSGGNSISGISDAEAKKLVESRVKRDGGVWSAPSLDVELTAKIENILNYFSDSIEGGAESINAALAKTSQKQKEIYGFNSGEGGILKEVKFESEASAGAASSSLIPPNSVKAIMAMKLAEQLRSKGGECKR